MSSKMIVEQIKRLWRCLPMLFMLYMRHYWWMYEIGVLLSIVIPLFQQYMCEETPLSFFQRSLYPTVSFLGYIVKPTCKYLEAHFKYRVYKYITIRTIKFLWKLGLERKAPAKIRYLFSMFLEFMTFLILVGLPLFDIYTCEEPTFGIIDDYLGSVLRSVGFVRQRECLNLFYFDVIRRYAIFTVPRVAFKIWWWYYGKRGFSWWSGSGSRTEVVARPEI